MKIHLTPSSGQVHLRCSADTAVECICEILENKISADYRIDLPDGKSVHTLSLNYVAFFYPSYLRQTLVFHDLDEGCAMHFVGDSTYDGAREKAFSDGNISSMMIMRMNCTRHVLEQMYKELERYIVR